MAETDDQPKVRDQAPEGRVTPAAVTESPAEETQEPAPHLPAEEVRPLPDPLEDKDIDAAVEAITKEDSDELLAAEDMAMSELDEGPAKHEHHGFFAAWWYNGWARWVTIVVLLAAVGGLSAVPKTRYFILNSVGVRSSLSLRVLDGGTQLPL